VNEQQPPVAARLGNRRAGCLISVGTGRARHIDCVTFVSDYTHSVTVVKWRRAVHPLSQPLNDLTNTGQFEARLTIPEGDLQLAVDKFNEFNYIRSPQQNPKNRPNREVFLHFFGMEVTWK
jgi:hypothetical protein